MTFYENGAGPSPRQPLRYLRRLEKLKGESQPVSTAGLQLQGDESQGQHRSFELQRSSRTFNAFDSSPPVASRRYCSRVCVCVCVPAGVCDQPGSGKAGE